jgi:hypothetical protein
MIRIIKNLIGLYLGFWMLLFVGVYVAGRFYR